MTEEVKAWTACPAQEVWMSKGAERAKEIEVVKFGTAGLDSSGNKLKEWRRADNDEKIVDKKKYVSLFCGYLFTMSVMD